MYARHGLSGRHFDSLSAEVVRRHTRHLPEHAAYKARKREKGGKHNHPRSRGV